MYKGVLGTGSEEIEGLSCDGFVPFQSRIYLINLTLAVKIKSLNSTTEATDFWGFAFRCCLSHTQKKKRKVWFR